MTAHDPLAAPDLLVIGLGTTGKAALEAARAAGVEAVGIDRGEPHNGDAVAHHLYGHRAWGIFGDGTITLASAHGARRSRPRAVIIATGSADLPLPVPGWERPGVIGAGRAVDRLAAGSRVVVLRGPHAGIGHRLPALDAFDLVADRDLDDIHALEFLGDASITGVIIDGDRIAADHVVLDNGIQPENILARMVGLPTTFSVDAGGDAVVPGAVIAIESMLLAVVGDAAGIHHNRPQAIAEAEDAGRILATRALEGRIPVSTLTERRAWPHGEAPRLSRHLTDDTLVCPAEGVTVGMVREAIAHGATTVNDVKRRTRAAMAACQGRDCLWTIRALLAEVGRDWRTPMTARPPAAAITLAQLAEIAAD